MKKYEAMFIIRPDLPDEEKNSVFNMIKDEVAKNSGAVTQAAAWAEERRKLYFPLKKYREGVFYLMNFEVAPAAIIKIKHAYRLNESILRVLLTKVD